LPQNPLFPTAFLKKNVYLLETEFFFMFSRSTLISAACALVFLTACAGSKGGSGSSSRGGGGGGGGGYDDDEYGEPAPRADQLKDARNEAVTLTEENHRMAKEIFELKNKLGLSTD
jgi:hypothetical protein